MGTVFLLRVTTFEDALICERRVWSLPIRIGRNALNDLQLLHPQVAEFHALIEDLGGKLCVRDINSQWGVWVRFAPHAPPSRIPVQQRVDLAACGFQFLVAGVAVVNLGFEQASDTAPRPASRVGSVLGNRQLLRGPGGTVQLPRVAAPQAASPRPIRRSSLPPTIPMEAIDERSSSVPPPYGPPPARFEPPPAPAPAPYAPSPYTPPPYTPSPYTPSPYTPSPAYSPPAYSSPPYSPPPNTPSSYGPPPYGAPPPNTPSPSGPPPYGPPPPNTPSPSGPPPSGPPPYGPPPYTPSSYGPPPITPSSYGPPPYNPSPDTPPPIDLPPLGAMPSGQYQGNTPAPYSPGSNDPALAAEGRTPVHTAHFALPLDSLALEAVRELAVSLVPERNLETTGDLARFVTKLHDLTEVFCRCFVPLREGHQQFIGSLDLQRAAEQRGRNASPAALAVETAKSPEALALALLDFREQALDAPKAVEGIFADLMIHQVALLDGVMRGVRALLDELSPSAIEQRVAPTGAFGLDLGHTRGKALWAEYSERYANFAEDEQALMRIFGPEFTEAYREYRSRQR